MTFGRLFIGTLCVCVCVCVRARARARARVVYCPSEHETFKVDSNLLGYMIIVSYFIAHKVISEVNTLTKITGH